MLTGKTKFLHIILVTGKQFGGARKQEHTYFKCPKYTELALQILCRKIVTVQFQTFVNQHLLSLYTIPTVRPKSSASKVQSKKQGTKH
jgi:hypothetical protein